MLQTILHDLIRFLRTDHGPILRALAGFLAPPIAATLAVRRGPGHRPASSGPIGAGTTGPFSGAMGAVPGGALGGSIQPAAAQPASPQAESTLQYKAAPGGWLEDAIRERLEQRRLPALPVITMESTDEEVDSFVDAFVIEQYPPGTGFAN